MLSLVIGWVIIIIYLQIITRGFAKIPRTIDIAAITTAATVLGSKIIDYRVEMKKLEEVKAVNRHRENIEDNSKELKEYVNKNEELKINRS